MTVMQSYGATAVTASGRCSAINWVLVTSTRKPDSRWMVERTIEAKVQYGVSLMLLSQLRRLDSNQRPGD
jgi:hypothetical protein